ncbi:MAG: sigma factor [Gemmataceae bacterium]
MLGVCRRVLGDPHAADDAFQATFLVLARKGGRIANPDALGGWLYGVAARVAVKARRGDPLPLPADGPATADPTPPRPS